MSDEAQNQQSFISDSWKLLYLATCTRLDITFLVGSLAKYLKVLPSMKLYEREIRLVWPLVTLMPIGQVTFEIDELLGVICFTLLVDKYRGSAKKARQLWQTAETEYVALSSAAQENVRMKQT